MTYCECGADPQIYKADQGSNEDPANNAVTKREWNHKAIVSCAVISVFLFIFILTVLHGFPLFFGSLAYSPGLFLLRHAYSQNSEVGRLLIVGMCISYFHYFRFYRGKGSKDKRQHPLPASLSIMVIEIDLILYNIF